VNDWKLERIGDGRYHIRGADGARRPGMILGGRGRWLVELAGRTWPGAFPSARAAAAALAEYHELRAAIADVREAYASVGADVPTDCDGAETMSAAQLRDEIQYIADFQG
jgi:hypothetical protein